jgi:hypothetical protein
MYGENLTAMRTGLADLLRHQNLQFRVAVIDGKRVRTTMSAVERAEHRMLIESYRQAVLVWCRQTLVGVGGYGQIRRFPPGYRARPVPQMAVPPVAALQQALEVTTDNSAVSLPSLEELTTHHPIPQVEAWRQLARAAALAEHDVGTAGTVPLTGPQAWAVIADIATICQALIVLDHRYAAGLPGWHRLHHTEQLGWTALACALDAGLGTPDYSVDRHGWSPPPRLVPGPTRPGPLGILQAEHNLLAHLREHPTVLELRVIVETQHSVSHVLSQRVLTTSPDTAERWSRRAETHRGLLRALRNLSGLVGNGRQAVGEAENAMARLATLPPGTALDPRLLPRFTSIFTKIDHRIADLIAQGIATDLIYQRAHPPAPRGATSTAGSTRAPTRPTGRRPRYQPLDTVTQGRLHALCDQLRQPAQSPQTADTTSMRSRATALNALTLPPGSLSRGQQGPQL